MSDLFNLEDHAAAEYAAAGYVVFPACLLTAAAELASRDKNRAALGCIHVFTDGRRVVAESTDSYAAARIVYDGDAEQPALDMLMRAEHMRAMKLQDGRSNYVAITETVDAAEVHTLKHSPASDAFNAGGSTCARVPTPFIGYPLVSRLFSDLEALETSPAPVWFNPARMASVMKAARRVDKDAGICMYSFKPRRRNGAAEPVEMILNATDSRVMFKAALMPCLPR